MDLKSEHKKNATSYSIEDVNNVVVTIEGTYFTYKGIKCFVNLLGKHQLTNLIGEIKVAEYLKLPMEYIIKRLALIKAEPHRMSVTKGTTTIIDDSYNANFDSLKYALKFLGTFPERKIAVIGTMLELGKYSQKLHTELGNFVVSENIDILITVGNDTEFINQKALELGFDENNQYHFTNNLDAINLIDSISKKNDVILIKASNGLKFKEIVEHLSK